MLKIAVVGTGGVGGYYGALLAQKQHEVTFIARGAHLRAIRQNGLQVRDVLGDFAIHPARATDRPDELDPVDLVLFCTKTYDTEAAATRAQALIADETVVVSLQNGLDAHERIGEIVGLQHMLAGITGITSMVEVPGIIKKTSDFAWIVIGELDGTRSARLEAVRDAFADTRAEVQVSDNIMASLWTKLLIVAPLAGFGSVTRLPIGDYRSIGEIRAHMLALKLEIAALAEAAHVRLEPGIIEKTMGGVDELPPHWKSSMQRDLESAHRSEVDAIIGVICRKARELGVSTPVADLLYAALLPADLQARCK